MRKRLALAALAAPLACSPVPASAYTALYSFGDSLSDVGNVFNLSGGTIPISPYYMGRFSNGPNWLDDLAPKLTLGPVTASFPPLYSGNDFAVGGAQTGPTNVNSGSLIDLNAQVARFSSSASGALFTLDIGANDIGNALTAYAANPMFDLAAFLTDAVANTVGAIDTLAADGMQNLLYFEVPDLSVVPAFKAAGALGGELAMEFNQDVLAGIKPLEAEGLTVFDVPIFNAIDVLVNYPEKYGFTNVTSACFSGSFDMAGTACSNPDQYLFWDTEHPTAAADALVADLADAVLTGQPNPIVAPEPATWAMMLIGFGCLGLAGWRANSRRVAPTS